MPRAKRRTPQLREHVLRVAVEMLAEDGVAGFTTRKLAHKAETSTPAVYELFGDKAGLVREVFFHGFRLLRSYLDRLEESDDPRADLIRLTEIYRTFIRDNPVLSELMFSRPVADFDPGPSDLEAGSSVREFIIERVRRWTDVNSRTGPAADETDFAHALVALTQGLAAAETSGRLGTSEASVDRRWSLAVQAMLDGLGRTTRHPAVD